MTGVRKSKVLPMPVRSSVPPTAVSMKPSSYSPPFDVVQELSANRDTYVGDQQATIYQFPSYLRTCLDRVRARVDAASKPGLSIALSCCTSAGLQVLVKSPVIKSLLALKEEFDLCDEVDAWTSEELANLFRSFSLSIPDSTLSDSRKQNLSIPDHLRSSLGSLSSDLGMSFSALVILCIMIALADQSAVLEERQRELVAGVELFLRRAQVRLRILQVLVDELKSDGGAQS